MVTVSELNKKNTAQNIRNKRDQLLINSDWTDYVSAQTRLTESQLQQARTYRQALRDVPAQKAFTDGDYDNITYPTKPDFL